MSQQTINVGAAPNDGTGTPLRTAFQYTNSNFTELYTAVGPSGNNIVVPGSATITGDLTVDTNVLKVDTTNNRLGIGTATPVNTLEVVAPAGDNIVSTFRSGDATAANNAGGGFRSISSATAANRVAQVWLDADGANFSGGDYFFIQKNGGSGTVEFNQSSNAAMVFLTNSTERMRIDSSGNVGIGVTPSAWGSPFKALQVSRAALRGSTATTGLSFNAYSDGTTLKYIAAGLTALDYYQNSGSHVWQIAGVGANANDPITFTQAMTLDASGNLLVGVTSGGTAKLDVRTSSSQRIINAFSTAAADSSTYGVYIGKFANDSTTAQRFIGFTINNDGAGSGQINANGASQAAFGTFSDSRLKENIVSLPSQLKNILSLRPVEFDYKDGSGHQIGFVAQEVQEVYSDAVSEQDGFLTVTGWSKTEARLVSAIKELAAKVQALEAKLA